jgi:hypothetical protein
MSDNDNNTLLLINIDKKVDEVKDKLHGIEVIQSRMEGDLKYHIKRTDLLEEQVEQINKNIQPVNAVKNLLAAIFKAIPLILGIIVGIFTIIKFIKE